MRLRKYRTRRQCMGVWMPDPDAAVRKVTACNQYRKRWQATLDWRLPATGARIEREQRYRLSISDRVVIGSISASTHPSACCGCQGLV